MIEPMERIIHVLILVTLFLLPLSQARVVLSGLPLYLPEILIGVSWVTFLFAFPVCRVPKRLPWPIVFGIGLFFVGAIVSAAYSGWGVLELGALKSWIIFPVSFGYIVYQSLVSVADRRRMSLWLFLGSVVTAAVSLLPFPFVHIAYDGRLASMYPSPNHLSMALAPGVIIGMYLLFSHESKRRSGAITAFSAGIGLLACAIFRTESVGGLVATTASLFTLLALSLFPKWASFQRTIMAILIVVVLAVVSVGAVRIDWSRLGDGTVRSSLGSRAMIWNASFRMIHEHPVTGIGLRQFEKEYLSLQDEFPPYLEWAVPHPHNILLALWLQSGLSGLVGLTFTFGYSIRKVWIGLADARTRDVRQEAALYLSLAVLILVHGMVDVPFFRNDSAIRFFALLGLMSAFSYSVNQQETKKRSPSLMAGDAL